MPGMKGVYFLYWMVLNIAPNNKVIDTCLPAGRQPAMPKHLQTADKRIPAIALNPVSASGALYLKYFFLPLPPRIKKHRDLFYE